MNIKKVSRIGVYGLVMKGVEALFITQPSGPFMGKFDFPGGGIEFGESAEETLRRELLEEINMTFHQMELLDNLTSTTKVPEINGKAPYWFHQIGLIYAVKDFTFQTGKSEEDLEMSWVNPLHITQENSSALLWKWASLYTKSIECETNCYSIQH